MINLIGRWHSANYSAIMHCFSFLFLKSYITNHSMYTGLNHYKPSLFFKDCIFSTVFVLTVFGKNQMQWIYTAFTFYTYQIDQVEKHVLCKHIKCYASISTEYCNHKQQEANIYRLKTEYGETWAVLQTELARSASAQRPQAGIFCHIQPITFIIHISPPNVHFENSPTVV